MVRTIETKLRNEILFSAYRIEEIRSHWLHRLGWVNAYSTEIIAAASAAGFVSPFISASARAGGGAPTAAAPAAELTSLTSGGDAQLLQEILAMSLGGVGAVVFALMLVLRVINGVHRMNDRYVIGKTALEKIEDFEDRIKLALQEDDDVARINDYASTTVRPTYDIARQGRCIPKLSTEATTKIDNKVDSCIQRLTAVFPDKMRKPIDARREPPNDQ